MAPQPAFERLPFQVSVVDQGLPGSRVTTLAAVEGLQWSDDQAKVPPEVRRSSLAPGPTSRVHAALPLFVTDSVKLVPAPTLGNCEAACAATTTSPASQLPPAGEVVAEAELLAAAEAEADPDGESLGLADAGAADGSVALADGPGDSSSAGELASGLAVSLRDKPNDGPVVGSEAEAFAPPVRALTASHISHTTTRRMTPRTARRRQ